MNNGNRLVSAVKSLSKNAPVNGLGSPKKVLLAHPNPGVGVASIPVRSGVTTTSGAYFQEPIKVPMGMTGVGATISAGLLIGAGIRKLRKMFYIYISLIDF
jgi:hypothetical protein